MVDDIGSDDSTLSKRQAPKELILHYRLIDHIASGGMGEVFLAQDTRLNRLVALKVLKSGKYGSDRNRQKIFSEARAAARVTHPNVCQIYDVAETEDSCLIVMEYVQGRTVREYIKSGMQPFQTILSIANQCCDGLEAAHNNGLVHRDLKPSNLMIDKNGYLRIMDFGLASEGHAEQVSDRAGTLFYMSPEQLLADPLDFRSDLFSLGVVFYELSTTIRPFSGLSPSDTARSIIEEAHSPMTELRPELPQDWSAIVDQLLEKKPADRFQTVSELRQKLSKFSAASPKIVPTVTDKIYLAILPLQSHTDDSDVNILIEGFTDELTNKLSFVPQLRVASRSAIEHLVQSDKDIGNAVKKLKITTILRGDIRVEQSSYRLSLELSSTADMSILWSKNYRLAKDELLSFHMEVLEPVLAALNMGIPSDFEIRPIHYRPANEKLYMLYLRAKYCLKKRDRQSIEDAISYLSEVVSKDKNFTAAEAELATALGIRNVYGFGADDDGIDRARHLAEHAVQTDPSSSQAHMALYFALRPYNVQKTITELRTAIALDETNYEAHHYLAHSYTFTGQYELACREELRALELDPFQEISRAHLARLYVYREMYEQAEQQMNYLRQGTDDAYLYHVTRGWILWRNRDWEAATVEFKKIIKEEESNQFLLANYADCLRRTGCFDEALSLLRPALRRCVTPYLLQTRMGQILGEVNEHDEANEYFANAHTVLDSQTAQSYREKSAVYLYDKAWIYAQSHDVNQALNYLEKSVEHGHGHHADLLHRPDWDRFINNPQFLKLIDEMKRRI